MLCFRCLQAVYAGAVRGHVFPVLCFRCLQAVYAGAVCGHVFPVLCFRCLQAVYAGAVRGDVFPAGVLDVRTQRLQRRLHPLPPHRRRLGANGGTRSHLPHAYSSTYNIPNSSSLGREGGGRAWWD